MKDFSLALLCLSLDLSHDGSLARSSSLSLYLGRALSLSVAFALSFERVMTLSLALYLATPRSRSLSFNASFLPCIYECFSLALSVYIIHMYIYTYIYIYYMGVDSYIHTKIQRGSHICTQRKSEFALSPCVSMLYLSALPFLSSFLGKFVPFSIENLFEVLCVCVCVRDVCVFVFCSRGCTALHQQRNVHGSHGSLRGLTHCTRQQVYLVPSFSRSLARSLTLLLSRSFSTSLYLSSPVFSRSLSLIHTPHTHVYIEKWVLEHDVSDSFAHSACMLATPQQH